MAEESKSQVNVTGPVAVGIGGNADHAQIQPSHLAILWRAQFRAGHALPNTATGEENYLRLLQQMKWSPDRIDVHLAEMKRETASPGL